MEALWVVPLGLIVGLALGALGGGGAILTVPVLVYSAHQTPQAATAGSLVIVGLSSLAGLIPHHRAKCVRYLEGLVFGALGIGGSLLGSKLSVLVAGYVLMTLFAALMVVVAIIMIRNQRRKDPGAPSAGHEPALQLHPFRIRVSAVVKLVLAATAVGLLTGFFGVGGGFAVVPALVLVMGFSMPSAAATSLLVIVLNSATALAGRLGAGLDLDWAVIGPFAVFAAVGGVFGGQLAQRIPQRKLTEAFIVMLILVAVGVGAANIPAWF